MATPIDEAIQKVTAAAEKIAPRAWELSVHYQRVHGLTDLCECALALACAVIFGWQSWVRSENADSFDRGPIRAISFLLAAVVVFFALINIPEAIARMADPETYAAKALLP